MKSIDSMYVVSWSPRILIEASAGTGKTYTLTALYIRLLVERKLNVDQILVMTFTNKATSELKERIFKGLKSCLYRLQGSEKSEDDFINEFADRVPNHNEAIALLISAIQNFDDSQIFTIHGFCQKILKEEALLAGTPFDFEIVQQDEILTQAVEDFWRTFMDQYSGTKAGNYYISKLLSIAKTPSELRNQLSTIFNKPYANIVGEGEVLDEPLTYLQSLLKKRLEMADMWNAEKVSIEEELLKSDIKGFTQRNVDSRMRKMENFLEDRLYQIDTFDQLKYFTSAYTQDPENLKAGKSRTPDHAFFQICDKYSDLVQDIGKVKTTVIGEAIKKISKIRERLSSNSQATTYDDLLNDVKTALCDVDYGDRLAKNLQKKYPYALVDEFQDTDPTQYSILNSIYPSENAESHLVMIGDPKQAIYAFRGADLYTYFKAREGSNLQQYTLHKNFRSTTSINQAVNTLFNDKNQPFLESEIKYRNVKTGKPELEDRFLIDGNRASGIRFISKPGIDSKKDDSNQFVFSQTVNEISRLLYKAENEKVLIENKKLMAGDIAVLVSSHRHAEEIKRRLKTVGIDSVTYSRENVFESAEAQRLEAAMSAILDPYRRINVNNALISGFWGQNLNEIHKLTSEGDLRQQLIDELLELEEVWTRDGFYPMFRKLLFSENRISKLAQYSNSERILTNLYQLADICAKAEKEGKLDPHALHSWFLDEMADPDKDDEKTLLLESDQNLVKVSTIHNSKGLEFPVVFCPTLWDVKSNRNKDLLTEYHGEDGDPIIRFDQELEEPDDDAIFKSNFEKAAEEVRKYYVAVTRAKYLCVIPWANHDASLRSGLALSLIESESVNDVIRNKTKLKSDTEFTDRTLLGLFKNLEKESRGSIEVDLKKEVNEKTVRPETRSGSLKNLVVRSYKGREELKVQRQVESFSSLAHQQSDLEAGEPDYDQVMESYLAAIHQEREELRELNIFTFPRGATAGTAIHKLFEDQKFRFNTALKEDHGPIIEKVLEQYQIDQKWKPVTQQMIRNVVSADIDGVYLSEIKEHEQLREMEFHIRVKQPSLENILGIIRPNREKFEESGDNLKSFLTGFIDLIIRENGKYYIVDYKSNYLGDTIDDYTRDHLQDEIYSASYDLQYHLYTLALTKYLESRVKEFNYERDFGGIAYLFVRGMRKGQGSGVWFHRPGEAVIRRLVNEMEVQI